MPKITKRLLDSLKPDPARDLYFWDDELTGFGLRLKPSGVTSYMIQYRTAEGISKRYTIGKHGVLTPDEARKLAKDKLAEVTKGGDPASEKKALRSSMTMEQLCDEYIRATEAGERLGRNGRLVKASTLAMDRSRIESHVKPLLGKRKVMSLTRTDLAKMQSDIAGGKTAHQPRKTADEKRGRGGTATGGKGVAARTLGMVGTIIQFAVSLGVIDTNPARGIEKFADNQVERALSAEELRALGKAMQDALTNHEASPTAIASIRLLLLTGCRRLEILGLKWSQVDLAGNCLRFDDREVGIKTGGLRPLGIAATVLLKNQQRAAVGCEWVFPGLGADGHFIGAPKVLDRLCAKAGLDGVTVHVLRHTFATFAAGMNYSPYIVAGLLGHSTPGVTTRYVHKIDEALVAAANAVSSKIAEHLGQLTYSAIVPRQNPPAVLRPMPILVPPAVAREELPSSPNMTDDFPQRMRAARSEKRLLIHNLARNTGIPVSFLEQIEAGKREPTESEIADIANVLGIALSAGAGEAR